jgi:hypothetical protein
MPASACPNVAVEQLAIGELAPPNKPRAFLVDHAVPHCAG